MATNWPPTSYPAWPPVELGISWLEFSDIQTGINYFQEMGFTRDNPTPQENNSYFKQVRCDHDDPCQGIMIVSPGGIRYPFAYCTGANHKAALVLWDVSHGSVQGGSYDLGWGSGVIT